MRISATAKPLFQISKEKIVEFAKRDDSLSEVSLALIMAAMVRDPMYYDKFRAAVADCEHYERISNLSEIISLSLFELEMAKIPDLRLCNELFEYACEFGRSMIHSKDYGFIEIFKLLVVSALGPFTYRLNQSINIIVENENNPKQLIEHILKLVRRGN
jgi:hypothetical protein